MLLRLPSSINPRKYTPPHLRCSERPTAPSNTSSANASRRPRTSPSRRSDKPATAAIIAPKVDVMTTTDSPPTQANPSQLTEQY